MIVGNQTMNHQTNGHGALPWPSGDVRNTPVLRESIMQPMQPMQPMHPPAPKGLPIASRSPPLMPHPGQQPFLGQHMHNPLNFQASSKDTSQPGPYYQNVGPQRPNPMAMPTPFVPGHHSSDSRSTVFSHTALPAANLWGANDRPRRGSFGPMAPQGPLRGGMKSQRGGRKDISQHGNGAGLSQTYSVARYPSGNGGSVSGHQKTSSAVNQGSNGQFNCHNGNSEPVSYIPCDCNACNHRNRSVYVKVQTAPNESTIEDIRARVKHGLRERFGPIEDVYVLKSKFPNVDMPGYMVR